MQYLAGIFFSFRQSSFFFSTLSFLFALSLFHPTAPLAFEAFSDNSSSNWETVVDDDALPDDTGSSINTNHRSSPSTNQPSRINERREQWKTARDTQLEDVESRPVDLYSPKQTATKTVTYSGRAEADGRSATLVLHFDGNNVSGSLRAKGVHEPGVRLPSTDVSFLKVTLNGPWESENTSIFADWTGGDYMDGVLIPDYPTKGSLSIQLAERNGEKVVYLHRVSTSQYGYVFPLKGVVYTPPDTKTTKNPDDKPTPDAGNGYWDPVGGWFGVLSGKTFDNTFAISLNAQLKKTGAVTVTSTGGNNKTESLTGKWNRQGNGITIKWSEASMKENDLDESSIYAFFDGENCLIVKDEESVVKLYRDSAAPGSKNIPEQTIFASGTEDGKENYGSIGAPHKDYSIPSFSNSTYRGPVKMSWHESRIFSADPRNSQLSWRGQSGEYGDVLSISSVSLESVFVTSGMEYEKSGNGARVTATEEGQHQVWLSYTINCICQDAKSGKKINNTGTVNFSWLVLVGIDEYKKWKGEKKDSTASNTQKADIEKFTITGVAKEVGSNQGVEGAFVNLGQKAPTEDCQTDQNGRFKCTFTELRSGRTELFIRKPYGKAGVGMDPIASVERDLWPKYIYMLELDAKKAATGMIVKDVIWMDRIGYLPNRHETDLAVELQK
jgi:hypothetical protein